MIDNQIIMLGRMIPKSGKIHQNQEVYSPFGLSPSLKATDYKNPPRVLIRRYGNKYKFNHRQNG